MGIHLENGNDSDNHKFILKGPDCDYKPPEHGLGCEIFNCMQKNKEKVAQIIADTDERDTYEDLLQRCVRTAIKLRARGFGSEDVICINSNNHKNTCVPYIAGIFCGIKVACIDPTLSLDDTKYLLNIVQPKIVFVSDNGIDVTEKSIEEIKLNSEIVVFGETHIYTPFDAFLESQPGEADFEPQRVNSLKDTALIFFSSGTTGYPKGICVTHYGLLFQPYQMVLNGAVETVSLCYSTFYWISATLFLLGTIYAGTSRVVCSKFDGAEIWHAIDKYRVRFLMCSPSNCADMVKGGKPDGIDVSSLKEMTVIGAKMPNDLKATIQELLPDTFLTVAYGSTEMCGGITCFLYNNPNHRKLKDSKPLSCGTLMSEITYKIVDPETEEILGPNQPGELRLKSPHATTGYYKVDSSDCFDSQGYLKTGDLMYYDDDLCFYVIDRIKQMLKYRGWQIAPVALEEVIYQHPAVDRAVVIGIPHPVDGDHPMALVVLKENAVNVTADDIANFVNGKMPDNKKLRGGVKFVKHIPVTPTGKVKRRDLKNMVLNGEI